MKKHKIIVTEIIINAPAKKVWDILTNLSKYDEWNPFIVKSQGDIKPGERLVNVLQNGDSTITFKPIVHRVEAPYYFEWVGNLYVPGIFDGCHSFRIVPISDHQSKLIHQEVFTGILASFIFRKIGNDTRESFIKMNQALKKETEKI